MSRTPTTINCDVESSINHRGLTRRALLISCPMLIAACPVSRRDEDPFVMRLRQIRERIGGRLGVHVSANSSARKKMELGVESIRRLAAERR